MIRHRRTRATLRAAGVLAGVLILGLAFSRPSGAAPEGRPCGPEPTDLIIEYGDLINCEIDRFGDIDVFRFLGGSGDAVLVRITRLNDEFACFELFDPDGVAFDDTSCGDQVYLLARTGTYTILVDRIRDGVSEYALALERIDPPPTSAVPIEYNQIIDDAIDMGGDVDVFFFVGDADDTIRLDIRERAVSDGFACFEIYGPDQVQFGAAGCGATEYLLAQTGRHTIVVTGFVDSVVDYSLTLACIDGACEASNLRPLEVAGCLIVKGTPISNQTIRLTQPDEAPQRTDTDVRGCFAFDVVRGKTFDVQVVASDVAD